MFELPAECLVYVYLLLMVFQFAYSFKRFWKRRRKKRSMHVFALINVIRCA
jgi:hypothetical protein